MVIPKGNLGIRAAVAGVVVVLLASGRALCGSLPLNDLVFTGGEDATFKPIDNTDIFDPASNGFSVGPAMAEPRVFHAQIPLGRNFVLVAGGANNNSAMSDAELLARATDTFTPTGSMSTPRAGAVFAALDSTHALVAGGTTSAIFPPTLTTSAEVFSLKARTFSPTGSMNVARYFPSAAKISHFVLVTGGEDVLFHALKSAELYDAKAGTFSVLPDMSSARVFHSSIAINNQFVVIMGGANATGILASAELFDLKTRLFTTLPNMHVERDSAAGARVNGRVVLIVGGLNAAGTVNKSAEIFNLATKTFTPVADMSVPRVQPVAVSMSGGRVLVASGGMNKFGGDPTKTVEIFDFVTKSFTPVGDMTTARLVPDASAF